MATIINNPPSQRNDDGLGVGLIVGMIIVVVFLGVLFFMYGLPLLQGGEGKQSESQNIEIKIPAITPSATTPAPTE